MKPLIVSLDQNHWIKLARSYLGKDKEYELILKKITNLVDSNDIIVPFSIERRWETIRRANRLQRVQFEAFVSDVSKAHFFKPRNLELLRMECHNYLCTMIGDYKRKINIKGETIECNYDKTFSNNEDERTVTNIYNDFSDAITDMEQYRKADKLIKDRQLFIHLNQFIILFIKPMLVDETIRMKIPEEKIVPIKDKLSDYLRFLDQIPSLNVSFHLVYTRYKQMQRGIQLGDIADINSLSVSIPYADLVVTDKFMRAISLQNKFDTKYDSIIVSDLHDLDMYI